MTNGELRIESEVVPHESAVTLVLLRLGDKPGNIERLDDASLRHAALHADELRNAWEEEIIRQAEYLQAEDSE